MNNQSITVIIPNYNSGGGLKKCIASIYNQLKKDDRIIIVDDASTDKSLSYIKEYLKKDTKKWLCFFLLF